MRDEMWIGAFCTDNCFEAIECGVMERNERIIREQMVEWNLAI